MRLTKTERDASFTLFMDQAGPALLRTAWFLSGDPDRAQELTQAAFVKTYLAWHKIDHGRALAYARRCLVNHKIDIWRATRNEVVADLTNTGAESGGASHLRSQSRSLPPAESPSQWRWPESAMATTDHRDDLVRRLSRLPEQQRKVLVLRYFADQSEASVAEALGISVGSVKSAASRGLAALRKHALADDHSPTPTPTPNASSVTEGSLR